MEFNRFGCGAPGWLAHGEVSARLLPEWASVYELAQAGVWDCLLTERCALLIRRPLEVRRDEFGRLHSTTAPAFAWRDGFCGYAFHQVTVPEWVITHPERLSPEVIWARQNVEERRALIDLYGRDRFLRESGAIVHHQDVDASGMPRRLLHLLFGASRMSVYVEVQCPSTRHIHILQVPPTVRNCHEAVAWTFGKTPADYAPVIEA